MGLRAGRSWTNSSTIATTIPAAISAGQASGDGWSTATAGQRRRLVSGDGWSTAIATLNSYDPNKVFSSPFLDTPVRLMRDNRDSRDSRDNRSSNRVASSR